MTEEENELIEKLEKLAYERGKNDGIIEGMNRAMEVFKKSIKEI